MCPRSCMLGGLVVQLATQKAPLHAAALRRAHPQLGEHVRHDVLPGGQLPPPPVCGLWRAHVVQGLPEALPASGLRRAPVERWKLHR